METILKRIQKLLALTVERGATPEEAASAAAKAQALLFEHNLSMAQVEGLGDGATDKVEVQEHELCNIKAWRKHLANTIALHNFCHLIDLHRRRVAIIGKPSNIEIVLYLDKVIGRQINTLAHRAKVEANASTSYYTSFCYGAVCTIRERLDEQREKDMEQAGSTALVVQSKHEIARVVKEAFPKLSHTSMPRTSDDDAFMRGVEAGKTIHFSKGIRAGQRQKAIQ